MTVHTNNQLGHETSPYLLQHKDNPVHWYPWGEEAFAAAKQLNRPILLSVGYAACHWCHVMAHESFCDQQTADIMNASFINIKLDREERPDIDKIYMDALHSLGEQGGWPLTMFLDCKGRPFWGGTYFPKVSQYGRPSFTHVLQEINRIWQQEPDRISQNANAIIKALTPELNHHPEEFNIDKINQAAIIIAGGCDMQFGGLKGAPKFPQSQIIECLYRHYLRSGDQKAKQAAIITLNRICQGGIYDHLEGGFCRYSVDYKWLVPHFEKMLYDNAQLLQQLSYALTDADNYKLFRLRIEETVNWLQTRMLTDWGLFAASYDADSEGAEGKYYTWQKHEISELISPDNLVDFLTCYDVSDEGNWEQQNILNRLSSGPLNDDDFERKLRDSRETLLKHRNKRIAPQCDDKSLTDWNSLAISALTHCAMTCDKPDWLQLAQNVHDKILQLMWDGEILYHSYRNGKRNHITTADGYANLITASLWLYQATGHTDYIDTARQITTAFEIDFLNEHKNGFYHSSKRNTALIVKSLYGHDDATVNANATMLSNYTRLFIITGDSHFHNMSENLHHAFAARAAGNPFAYAGMINAAELHIKQNQALIFQLDNKPIDKELVRVLWQYAGPNLTISHISNNQPQAVNHPATEMINTLQQSAILICEAQTCYPPMTTTNMVIDHYTSRLKDTASS